MTNDNKIKNFEKFSGNYITSLRGFPLFISVAVIIYLMINATQLSFFEKFIFFVPIIAFYFGAGSEAYYFLVSPTQLVIKNQLFWWVNKTYELRNIDKVSLISATRQHSKALSINTKDSKSKKYPAGSLRKHTWKEIQNKFESFGIKVQNEFTF